MTAKREKAKKAPTESSLTRNGAAKKGKHQVAAVARRGTMPIRSAAEALADQFIAEAIRRGIMKLDADGRYMIYALRTEQKYPWNDPEEWVRAATVAWLVLDRDYPTNRIKLEVRVPRRVPNDYADIVVFKDDACLTPYLVVENKQADQSDAARAHRESSNSSGT